MGWLLVIEVARHISCNRNSHSNCSSPTSPPHKLRVPPAPARIHSDAPRCSIAVFHFLPHVIDKFDEVLCNRDPTCPLGTQCSVVEQPTHTWILKLDNHNTLYLNIAESAATGWLPTAADIQKHVYQSAFESWSEDCGANTVPALRKWNFHPWILNFAESPS
jgi:hypothetical protein